MQPISFPIPDWRGANAPSREAMSGEYCRLEPLQQSHARDLWNAFTLDTGGENWTYLPYGPFPDFGSFESWLQNSVARVDVIFFAIVSCGTEQASGVASYLRIDCEAGSIEVGHLNFSLLLQRTRAATEAMYLMMRSAFEAGFRRYEWKCNALNAPSCRAARRLGFTFEGVFRQAAVVKGRNRDTAWFSVLDGEWPALKIAFEQWLKPENFDDAGQQKIALEALRRQVS